MAVENHDGDIVVTGNDIPVFQLLAIKLALRMEINGMKHSSGVSRMKILAEMGIVPVKKRYTHAEKSATVNLLDRIYQRAKNNRAAGINESLDKVIETIKAEMTIEKAVKANEKNGK